jgi:hypothetical protein
MLVHSFFSHLSNFNLSAHVFCPFLMWQMVFLLLMYKTSFHIKDFNLFFIFLPHVCSNLSSPSCICVTELFITVTNAWENQHMKRRCLFCLSFGGFIPWLLGSDAFGPVKQYMVVGARGTGSLFILWPGAKDRKRKGLVFQYPLQGYSLNDQKTLY